MVGIPAIVVRIHRACSSAFAFGEHCCALLYAVCEFTNAHRWLSLASAFLLIVGGFLLVTSCIGCRHIVQQRKRSRSHA